MAAPPVWDEEVHKYPVTSEMLPARPPPEAGEKPSENCRAEGPEMALERRVTDTHGVTSRGSVPSLGATGVSKRTGHVGQAEGDRQEVGLTSHSQRG